MMPTADQQEQIKMAQHAQRRLAQGFEMYTFFIANGSPIEEALMKMEAAIEAWTDYEDRHTVEMPMAPDILTGMMANFHELMDTMKARTNSREEYADAEPATPEELEHAEQAAWDEYQAIAGASFRDPTDKRLYDAALAAEHHWRSFGTAHLRHGYCRRHDLFEPCACCAAVAEMEPAATQGQTETLPAGEPKQK